MNFLRVRRIAQRLEFFEQLIEPAMAVSGRGKLECESRWLKTNYARIVAGEMLEEPLPQVVSLADVNPESVEETIDAGRFGCVFHYAFALKQIAAVASLGKGHRSPVLDALCLYLCFDWFELKK